MTRHGNAQIQPEVVPWPKVAEDSAASASPRVLIVAGAAVAAELQIALAGAGVVALPHGAGMAPRSDIVLIDLDLGTVPTMQGFAPGGDSGVIAMVADAGPEAAITALESGANDYMVKPVAVAELAARIRALHAHMQIPNARRPVPIVIDPDRSVLLGRRGRVTPLSAAELTALETLLDARGTRVSHDWLRRVALNRPLHVDDRSADRVIASLRMKLTAHGAPPRALLSARRQGYAITDPTLFRITSSRTVKQ